MRSAAVALYLCLFLYFFTGCSNFIILNSTKSSTSDHTISDTLISKALILEKQMELNKALLIWEVIACRGSHYQTDQTVQDKIKTLQNRIEYLVKTHYDKGCLYYNQKALEDARREFLIILRYQPQHAGALDYLKNRLTPPVYINYQVAPKDTLQSIAKAHYNDVKKALLLAWLNDLDDQVKLKPGTLLCLPVLPKINKVSKKSTSILSQAKRLVKKEQYSKALAMINKLLNKTPNNSKLILLADAVHIAMARPYILDQKYEIALSLLNKVSPSYPGIKQIFGNFYIKRQAYQSKQLLQIANSHLIAAEYDKALQVTNEILLKDPENREVSSLVDAAHYALGRKLAAGKNEYGAWRQFKKVSPGYKNIGQLMQNIQKKLNKTADTYYKTGVKYYLRENLAGAIQKWKQTLKYNPQHPKAAKDIARVERLLEKLKKVN